MQNYQNITLDVNNRVEYKYINAKQGDHNSRFLNITLVENGNKIIPTGRSRATFRCLKPDGKICFNNSIINDDGSITVCLTQQILAVKGTVRADISLIEGSTVLSSATFFIQVESSPLSEKGALSSDEFLVLIEKIEEVDALSSKVQNAAEKMETAENGLNELNLHIESINQNVESVQNEVQTIKDDIININNNLSEIGSQNEEIIACFGYTENDILGLCVDYENKRFTRLAGAAGKNAGADFDVFHMYGGRRRCTVTADGTITAFYGDENYTVDDKTVQVMVYQPKFYYRIVPLKLEKIENGIGYHIRRANYYVSDTPKMGFKLHPAFYDENGKEIEYILYSAYEGTYAAHYLSQTKQTLYFNDAIHNDTTTNLEEDCIMSISGTKPISGLYKSLTRANAEKLCSNFGNGWHCETIKTLSANQLLMMIEFGTMNMQQAVEDGVIAVPGDSSKSRCCYAGSTNSLGNNTGHASSSSVRYDTENAVVSYNEPGKRAVSYRGIENPWGNLWKWIQGINVYGTSINDRQMYVASDFNFKESTHTGNYEATVCRLPEENSYISAMGYNHEKFDWLFMPTENNGASNLPVGDTWNSTLQPSQIPITRTYLYGGSWSTGIASGAFRISNLSTSSDKSSAYGCRTVFIPTAEQ